MPNDLEARTRRVLELAETMRTTSHPPTTDTEAFMAAADEWGKLLASGWPEEIAQDWLRLRQGFMPPVKQELVPPPRYDQVYFDAPSTRSAP